MVDNVVQFTGHASNISKRVEFILDFYKDLNLPPLMIDMIKSFSADGPRKVLFGEWVNNVNPGYQPMDTQLGSGVGISLDTITRPRVFSNFGIQNHLEFFSVKILELPEGTTYSEIGSPKEFPNLMHMLTDYYLSCGTDSWDNLTVFCYAAVSFIMTNDKFRFIATVEGESYKDRFGFQIVEVNEMENPTIFYQFEFDYLPIVIDNAALRAYGSRKEKG